MNVKNRQLQFLPYILISLVAFIVVLFRFLLCRSLWLDEAALANNLLLENSILNNTTYMQCAPPLFKIISLFFIKIFGVNEYSLRIFPFVCYIFSLPIFYFLLNKLITDNFAKFFAFTAFCLNPLVLYYAVEFKQYSCDIMLCLFIILLCYYFDFNKIKIEHFSIFCIFYSFVIWLSHFSLFLFVPLLAFFILSFQGKSSKLKLFLFISSFLISFIPYYFLHLSHISSNPSVNNYWSNSFINSFENLPILFNAFFSGAFPCVNYFILFCLILISIVFFKKDFKNIFLILFFASPFVASFLSLYPFCPRLFLPLVPLIILFVFSLTNKSKLSKIILLLIFLPYFLYCTYGIFDKKSLYREEMRPLLEYLLRNISPNDTIYLKRGAHQAFNFYTKKYDNAYKINNEVISEQYCSNGSELCNLKKGKTWVVCTNYSNNLPKKFLLLDEINFDGVNLYYIIVE